MSKNLTTRAYEIVQDWMLSNEDFVMMKVKEGWPVEYAKAVEVSKTEDDSIDDDHVPNLSIVCEQVIAEDEERFLKYLSKIY
jgi:hypothetical protein